MQSWIYNSNWRTQFDECHVVYLLDFMKKKLAIVTRFELTHATKSTKSLNFQKLIVS